MPCSSFSFTTAVYLPLYKELSVLLRVKGKISSKFKLFQKRTPVSFTDLKILETLLVLNKLRYS